MQAWLSLIGQLLFIILVGSNAAFIYVFLRDQYHIIAMTALTTALLLVATVLHMTLFFRTISVAEKPRAPTKPKPAPKQPAKAAYVDHTASNADDSDVVVLLEDGMEEELDPSKRGMVWHFSRNVVTAIKTQLLEQGTFRWAASLAHLTRWDTATGAPSAA